MSTDARELRRPGALESLAHELGAGHAVATGSPRVVTPLAGLDAIPSWLTRAEEALAAPDGEAAKAAEWVLDNAYVVRRAIRQIREDMPAGFYARLRPLATDDGPGAPRVYELARALLRSTDAQLTPEAIAQFVNAYQEVRVLDIAELWAFPTMLRLACLELLVGAVARLTPVLAAPFTADACAPAPAPLDDTECVARAIRGLATVAALSWKDFFRRTSAVERVLEEDPLHVYAQMDFDTCNGYRKVVEELAHRAGRSEVEVARCAIETARRLGAGDTSRAHVGYWLIDEGRPSLEATLGYRPGAGERWRRRMRSHAGTLYASAVVGATAAAAALPAAYLHAAGAHTLAWIAGMSLVLLPASALALTAVHAVVTLLVSPHVLPKLDFAGGIRPAWKTAVVIPCLLGEGPDVARLLRRLERHFLANPDPALQFVLLSDFTDAASAHMPGDDALVDAATAGIRALNARHGSTTSRPFHLLHRERRYDPAEGCWMGWERKRGKLDELNRLLGGDDRTSDVVREGDPAGLDGIRFVITLDSDTLLPQGAAAQLVGTLAHPLNRRRVRPRKRSRATPGTRSSSRASRSRRTAATVHHSHASSRATRASTSTADAVSDVYQDLFGTGIYVGKGIYDVDAFARSLEGRVPENALASHDLFEGAHGRVALATDVVLYEDYPATLPRVCPAPAPLDARRLAAPALALAVASRRRTAWRRIGSRPSTAGRSSTTCGAACCRRRGSCFLVAGWLCLPGTAGVDDARRARSGRQPRERRRHHLVPRTSWTIRTRRARRAPLDAPAITPAAGSSRSSFCLTRRSSPSTPSCAHSYAIAITRRHLLQWTAGRADDGRARRSPTALSSGTRWPVHRRPPSRSRSPWSLRRPDRLARAPRRCSPSGSSSPEIALAPRARRHEHGRERLTPEEHTFVRIRSPAARGYSSKPSSAPMTSGFRPTTTRSSRTARSPTARRRPTSA